MAYSETAENNDLWKGIIKMSEELGFAGCGCAKAVPLSGGVEEKRYAEAEKSGHFGKMDYLKRNVDKRMDPSLLLPGAKSIILFLAPFGGAEGGSCQKTGGTPDNGPVQGKAATRLRISEFAQGEDYHTVIKNRLFRIAQFIEEQIERKLSSGKKADSAKIKLRYCRVFTDSAPVLERAWAVRAGLGFIGKNNFLISPTAGIKNFIGTIITVAELPYPDKTVPNGCGQCTRCLDACTQKALYAPFRIDASKCLSYKTIEEPLNEADNLRTTLDGDKWIFGCDDCMNACPWNRFNKEGWKEFYSNRELLAEMTREEWEKMTEEDFLLNFNGSPLKRAGVQKIKNNISR